MANFNIESRSLSSHYVYYSRLKQDGFNNLHDAVLGHMRTAKNEAEQSRVDTTFLRAQADMERQKELNLIERVTGIRPSAKHWGEDADNIIDAINLALSLKDIYKRSYTTIVESVAGEKGTQGKGIYSFFGGYLQSAIRTLWPDFASRTKLEDLLGPRQEDIILSWLQNEVLQLAIKEMLSGRTEVERLNEDPAMRNAYQELLGIVGKFNQKGSFAAEMADIFDLETVAREVAALIDIGNVTNKPGGIKSLTGETRLQYTRGGYTLEAIQDLITEAVQQKKGIKGGHARVGQFNAKADNIATIGIDYSRVEEYLAQKDLGRRKENVEAFRALGKHLEDFSDGFIIYTSAKNYTINEGFKERGGFSAGEPLSFETYAAIMKNAHFNVDVFIGAMEQLAKGAVGQDMDRRDYAHIISKNIAYLLFDDFDVEGAGLQNGPQSIHIMNLNGVLVPISSILYALADAIESNKGINNIVKTTLHIPEIAFKSKEDQRSWEAENPGKSAWEEQRKLMLQKATIETHFLGNLKQILEKRMFK